MAKCPECGAEWSWEEGEEEFCMECGYEPTVEERMAMMTLEEGGAGAGAGADKYANFVIGLVQSVESIPKKDKLKACEIQIAEDEDDDDAVVTIVTNAKYVDADALVVVALPGAVVPAGADADDDDVTKVTKSSVGGRMSHGMLCDSAMLGWKGGAAGVAVKLNGVEGCAVGGKPPSERPAGAAK